MTSESSIRPGQDNPGLGIDSEGTLVQELKAFHDFIRDFKDTTVYRRKREVYRRILRETVELSVEAMEGKIDSVTIPGELAKRLELGARLKRPNFYKKQFEIRQDIRAFARLRIGPKFILQPYDATFCRFDPGPDLLADETERDIIAGIGPDARARQTVSSTQAQKVLQTSLQFLSDPFGARAWDFERLAGVLRGIDKGLMRIIRDLSVPQEEIEEAYIDLLRQRLMTRGVSLDDLIVSLNQRKTLSRIAKSRPRPDLRIDVSDNFDRIVYSHGTKSIPICNPTLLWECACRSKRKCEIHSHENGQEISRRFGHGFVQIVFRGRRFYWREGPELWPPSADSFWMLNDLDNAGVLQGRYESVLDVGSGTGFLGIAVASMNLNVVRLVMTDWLLSPLLFGLVNWSINGENRQYVQVEGKLGLFTDSLTKAGEKFDLIVCNPPYLPLLEEHKKLGRDSTVAGTDLLVHLIEAGHSLGKNIYLQFSHLAAPEARAAARRAKVRLRPIGPEREVPFRVPLAYGKPAYLRRLKKDRKLIPKRGTSHQYWHKIRTYVLQPK